VPRDETPEEPQQAEQAKERGSTDDQVAGQVGTAGLTDLGQEDGGDTHEGTPARGGDPGGARPCIDANGKKLETGMVFLDLLSRRRSTA
jgi:hypothetical protein